MTFAPTAVSLISRHQSTWRSNRFCVSEHQRN